MVGTETNGEILLILCGGCIKCTHLVLLTYLQTFVGSQVLHFNTFVVNNNIVGDGNRFPVIVVQEKKGRRNLKRYF